MWKRLVIVAVAVWGLYFWLGDRPITHGPGVTAPNPPVQTKLSAGTPFSFKDYTITPLASFKIEARVLGRENYYLGRESGLSPTDLALGWGPMSDEAVIDKISIRQSNRWYTWRVSEWPIPRRQIETNSANMHLIPANDDVASTLKTVRTGNIVRFSGYLVRIKASDGWRWQSSVTRDDTGDGSCELIWVESLSIL